MWGVRTFFLGLVCLCSPAFAWGELGHELINHLATAQLGQAPYGPWLANQDYLLKRYAVTPDADWKSNFYPLKNRLLSFRRNEIDRYEGSNHFLSWDAFYPRDKFVDPQGKIHTEVLNDFPRGAPCASVFDQLSGMLSANADTFMAPGLRPLADPSKPTRHEVFSQGTLPWRVLQLYDLAVRALVDGDFPRAVFLLGVIGHYVGDLAQPFHNSIRYNPFGIHGTYETQVLHNSGAERGLLQDRDYVWSFGEREQTLAQKLSGATPAPLTRDEIYSSLIKISGEGYAYMDPLTQAYHKALRGRPELEHPWGTPPPDDRIAQFGASEISDATNGIPKQTVLDSAYSRMSAGSQLLARIWASAFAEAAKANPKLLDPSYYVDKSGKVPVRTDLGESPSSPAALQGFSRAYAIFNYPVLENGDPPKKEGRGTFDERRRALPAPSR